MAKIDLPYSRHSIAEDDIAEVAEVLRSDWLTGGPSVNRFENLLAAETRAQHAVACANGTAALHLAMMALDIGPGDAVVVPTVTFLATANAVRFVGGEVVFADVDPDTGLLTSEALLEALTRVPDGLRARAVIPVHLRGLPCDMPTIADVATSHDLGIVEDAAHALGSWFQVDGEAVAVGQCTFSAMTCFSFHAVKTIAMGEGGAVTTNDPALAMRLRSLQNHGIIRDPKRWTDPQRGVGPEGDNPWHYEMQELGYNYRVSDIQCALGVSQLRKLDRFVASRAALAACYDAALAELSPVVQPHVSRPDVAPAWHLYSALIDFAAAGISRGRLMAEMGAQGISTQVHFIPVHAQPYYRERYGHRTLPGSERYYQRTLSLPLHPALGDAEIHRVVATIRRGLSAPVEAVDSIDPLAAAAADPVPTACGTVVWLRPMEPADEAILFAWQCEDGARRHSNDPRPPTRDEHAAWMASKLADNRCRATIIVAEGRPTGILRLDHCSGDTWQVSILVAGDQRGKGIGTAALRAANRLYPELRLVAQIHPDNAASLRAFARAAYHWTDADLYQRGAVHPDDNGHCNA